ncbi:carboxylesterase family protein [Streptomyces sp. NA04227]|uniref:carboxylesterase/lipase family protein n=1 Tax=Streptomyces sp. NA04227 TaxID=2742136 RepID=UPI001591CE88|nr:carboxylesterase family protein [Streptomyces sp. NA04227]QKW07061.1 carboxylesterase family protein [Streptomyces sp. NA04227]
MRAKRPPAGAVPAGALALVLAVAGLGLSATQAPATQAPAAPAPASAPASAPTNSTELTPADDTLVVTDKGPVRGKAAADHREFLGIPYASKPARWGSPRPAAPWSEPRDATRPGPRCAQSTGVFPNVEPRSESEDCLYLNVTTPRHVRGKKLPVMVWVHGSGFRNGAGDMYRPQRLADRGEVIVVTVNYRLGLFGFLAHPALDGGPARHKSGNFGLEDQQEALRWVRRNAGAFGGDPSNVTLFGESAGGVSTCSQLASPAAAGLFHRAAVQSGPCLSGTWPDLTGVPDPNGGWLPLARDKAEKQGRSVAGALGCTDPATVARCLRGTPAREVMAVTEKAEGDLRFTSVAPVYGGGGLLPESPAAALAAGRFHKVPVLHGITRDEFHTFQAVAAHLLQEPPLTVSAYEARVREFFGEPRAAKVLARYPADRYHGPDETWSKLITDLVFARSASDMNHTLARQVPTYAYQFADADAPWATDVPAPSFPTRAFHAAELQYQFDTDYFTGRTLTPDQRHLGDRVIDYWSRFARTGDPNGPGAPYWPRADRAPRAALSLAPGHDGIRPVDFDRDHDYAFWKSLVATVTTTVTPTATPPGRR